MIRLSKQVLMYCCLVLVSKCKVDSNVVDPNCSCYSFHEGLSSRRGSQNKCKKEGGDLVSMETLEEWEFIKAQIQNKTTEDGNNEWWIGLQRTNDGNWTWLTNHSLTYHVKWLEGRPDDSSEEKYVTIVKEFNSTQGWFNQSTHKETRAWICEYSKLGTKCNDDKIPRCKPLVISINTTTKGSNQSDSIPPQDPSECAVRKNQRNYTIIPIIVAVVGLLVIVSINIIVVKWRCAKNDSRKKRDRPSSHSEKLEMDAIQSNTSDVNVLPGSGINQDKEKCLQPDQEYIGSSTTDKKGDISDGITDVDVTGSNSHKLKPELPYYVNVPGVNEGHTDNDHYASVDDISEKAGKKDGFVVVQTYSIVHHTDDNDGQTDTYATVNDVLDKDRQTDVLATTEPGYACVDVIKKTVSVRSGEHSRTTSDAQKETSHDTTGTTQYAVVDFKRKSSKKIKVKDKEPDNQSQPEPGYASVDVIKKTISVRSGEHSRTTSDAQKETSHDAAGTTQYAVVDMNRKRSKNIKAKEPNNQSQTADAQNAPSHVATGTTPYAVVDFKNKSSKKIKAKEPDNQNQPESGASVDVSAEKRPSVRVHSEEHSRTANDAQNAPSYVATATTQYAVVDMKRKRSKKNKTKEPDHPKLPDVGAIAEVIYDNCQYGPPVQDHEGTPGNNNSQQTLANNVPNTDVQVQYAAVDKSKKKNSSVKVPAQSTKSGEASYASVDVIYANCWDQEKRIEVLK